MSKAGENTLGTWRGWRGALGQPAPSAPKSTHRLTTCPPGTHPAAGGVPQISRLTPPPHVRVGGNVLMGPEGRLGETPKSGVLGQPTPTGSSSMPVAHFRDIYPNCPPGYVETPGPNGLVCSDAPPQPVSQPARTTVHTTPASIQRGHALNGVTLMGTEGRLGEAPKHDGTLGAAINPQATPAWCEKPLADCNSKLQQANTQLQAAQYNITALSAALVACQAACPPRPPQPPLPPPPRPATPCPDPNAQWSWNGSQWVCAILPPPPQPPQPPQPPPGGVSRIITHPSAGAHMFLGETPENVDEKTETTGVGAPPEQDMKNDETTVGVSGVPEVGVGAPNVGLGAATMQDAKNAVAKSDAAFELIRLAYGAMKNNYFGTGSQNYDTLLNAYLTSIDNFRTTIGLAANAIKAINPLAHPDLARGDLAPIAPDLAGLNHDIANYNATRSTGSAPASLTGKLISEGWGDRFNGYCASAKRDIHEALDTPLPVSMTTPSRAPLPPPAPPRQTQIQTPVPLQEKPQLTPQKLITSPSGGVSVPVTSASKTKLSTSKIITHPIGRTFAGLGQIPDGDTTLGTWRGKLSSDGGSR